MLVKTIILWFQWTCTCTWLCARAPCYLCIPLCKAHARLCAPPKIVHRRRNWVFFFSFYLVCVAYLCLQRIKCERCIIIISMSCGHLWCCIVWRAYTNVRSALHRRVRDAWGMDAACGQSLFECTRARMRLARRFLGTRQNRMVFTPQTHRHTRTHARKRDRSLQFKCPLCAVRD